MKREAGKELYLFFASIIFICLFSFLISAVDITCTIRASCQSSETIVMGLSDTTNSHGQIAGYSSPYSYFLCCTPASTSISCLSSNKIIGLSDTTNAHAEIPEQANYSTNICYEGLSECIHLDACSTSYPIQVLSLSDITNAHIGGYSDYGTKICCKTSYAGAACGLTASSWEVTSASEGDSVNMIVSGTNCDSTQITFNVYSKVQTSGQDTLVNSVTGVYAGTNSWKATLGLPSGASAPDKSKYYFTAKTPSTTSPVKSNDLTVSQGTIDNCLQSTCGEYTDKQSCEGDCANVAGGSNPTDPGCQNLPSGVSCSCLWSNNKCEPYAYTQQPEMLCGDLNAGTCGSVLCTTNLSNVNMDYCYPDLSCPSGMKTTPLNPFCNNKSRAGCYDKSCSSGSQDSCSAGTACYSTSAYGSAGLVCQPLTGCGSAPANITPLCQQGYNLCVHNGKFFCNPGSCASNENTATNGICGAEDGCSSADCKDGDQASCAAGFYCNKSLGSCYSPNTVGGNGRCIFHETTTNNCDTTGQLQASWTVNWTGGKDIPSYCVAGSRVAPCAAQIQVPFFGVYQTIAALGTIAIIYFCIILRKRFLEKKKKK